MLAGVRAGPQFSVYGWRLLDLVQPAWVMKGVLIVAKQRYLGEASETFAALHIE